MTRHCWTPEMDAKLREMHAGGVPRHLIAEQLGVSIESARCRGVALNLPARLPGPQLVWTPEMDAELARLRRLGMGHTRIGAVVGVSAPAVKKRLDYLGFPPWPHGSRGVRNLAA